SDSVAHQVVLPSGIVQYSSGSSYGWNTYATGSSYPDDLFTPFHHASLAGIEDPSGTLMVAEGTYYRVGGYAKIGQANIDNMSQVLERHFDGTNVLFGDGHVKWLKRAPLIYNVGDTVPGIWTPQAGD